MPINIKELEHTASLFTPLEEGSILEKIYRNTVIIYQAATGKKPLDVVHTESVGIGKPSEPTPTIK